VWNVRSPEPENRGDGGNHETNRILIVARDTIWPWSVLLSTPGAGEEEVPDLLQRSPAGVGALPGDVARLADADVLRALLGEGSPKIYHPLAVPDRVGGLLEEVPEHVFAPEVTAASDHAPVEINREIHPGLMTEGVEGPLRGRALIPSVRGARAAFLPPLAAWRRNSPSGLIRLVRLDA
jgi:hypothetical protein